VLASGLTISVPGGLENVVAKLNAGQPASPEFQVRHLGPPVRAGAGPER
jgi:hypothetical protein